jgi:glycosyltransferase involved in cell wall biosynthesis
MDNREVASLYRHPQIKALVALTRGEGFGLPILEAAASGLPVITTNWSGHLDFMEKGKFLKIDYDLKEISNTKIDKRKCPICNGQNGCRVCSGTGFTQIFVEGSKWAEPKENSAKKIFKKFKEMPAAPREWAEKLAVTIREE